MIILSFISGFVGFLLIVNWIPVNPKGLTIEQKKELLEIGSINRPLGLFLIYGSIALFVVAIVRYIYLKQYDYFLYFFWL